MTISLTHYLAVAAILFTIGVFGIFVNRKNIIVILMSIEMILLAVNINLVAFSVFLHQVTGQIFAMFVLTVAAAGNAPLAPGASDVTNAEAIGRVLYTDYVYFFEAAGLVLLIAMIGAIVLTLKHRPFVRRQSVSKQMARTVAGGVEVVSIKSGEGAPE